MGSTADEHGARQRTMPFEDFYEIDGTKLATGQIGRNERHPTYVHDH